MPVASLMRPKISFERVLAQLLNNARQFEISGMYLFRPLSCTKVNASRPLRFKTNKVGMRSIPPKRSMMTLSLDTKENSERVLVRIRSIRFFALRGSQYSNKLIAIMARSFSLNLSRNAFCTSNSYRQGGHQHAEK